MLFLFLIDMLFFFHIMKKRDKFSFLKIYVLFQKDAACFVARTTVLEILSNVED